MRVDGSWGVDNAMNPEIAVEASIGNRVAVDTAEKWTNRREPSERRTLRNLRPDLLWTCRLPVMDGCGGRTYPCTEEGGCENASDHRHDGQRLCGRPAKAKDAGMNGHLAKPIDMDQLRLELEKWL